MDVVWTPWSILAAAAGALFAICTPFMLRQLRRQYGSTPGFRAQVLFHVGLTVMVLGSTWPARTAVTQAVVVLGCALTLAGWVWFRRRTRADEVMQRR